MHLDPTEGGDVGGVVVPMIEIEVRVELQVDAGQQVKIEGGGEAGTVVVCGVKGHRVFFEINANEEIPALTEGLSDAFEESYCIDWQEVTDRPTGEKPDARPKRKVGGKRYGVGVIGKYRPDKQLGP